MSTESFEWRLSRSAFESHHLHMYYTSLQKLCKQKRISCSLESEIDKEPVQPKQIIDMRSPDQDESNEIPVFSPTQKPLSELIKENNASKNEVDPLSLTPSTKKALRLDKQKPPKLVKTPKIEPSQFDDFLYPENNTQDDLYDEIVNKNHPKQKSEKLSSYQRLKQNRQARKFRITPSINLQTIIKKQFDEEDEQAQDEQQIQQNEKQEAKTRSQSIAQNKHVSIDSTSSDDSGWESCSKMNKSSTIAISNRNLTVASSNQFSSDDTSHSTIECRQVLHSIRHSLGRDPFQVEIEDQFYPTELHENNILTTKRRSTVNYNNLASKDNKQLLVNQDRFQTPIQGKNRFQTRSQFQRIFLHENNRNNNHQEIDDDFGECYLTQSQINQITTSSTINSRLSHRNRKSSLRSSSNHIEGAYQLVNFKFAMINSKCNLLRHSVYNSLPRSNCMDLFAEYWNIIQSERRIGYDRLKKMRFNEKKANQSKQWRKESMDQENNLI